MQRILEHPLIGSLLYLSASRPDILFSIYICARLQSNSKESHLLAIKKIFIYLMGTQNLESRIVVL